MIERRGDKVVMVHGEIEIASVDIRLWREDERACRRFLGDAGAEYWCADRYGRFK